MDLKSCPKWICFTPAPRRFNRPKENRPLIIIEKKESPKPTEPKQADTPKWPIIGLLVAQLITISTVVPTLVSTCGQLNNQRKQVALQAQQLVNTKIITDKQINAIHESQISDQLIKATKLLADNKIEARLGGIYSLERIANNFSKECPKIVEILAAFIRVNAGKKKFLNKKISNSDKKFESVHKKSKIKKLIKNYIELTTDIRSGLVVIQRLPSQCLKEINKINLSIINLPGFNLTSLNFNNFNLKYVDFSWAKLIGATLKNTNLSGANLSGAILRDADLARANLSGANLIGANLRDADLSGADLSGANLSGANLRSAKLTAADLTRAKLIGANLMVAHLMRADLTFANLRTAKLMGANLNKAKLVAADLRGSDLGLANLSDADLLTAKLSGANLTGTVVNGTDLTVLNLKGVKIDKVFYNSKTIFPKNIKLDKKWIE